MDGALRSLVWARAADACEYCRLEQAYTPTQRHHVEHIVPRQHNGPTEESNLALACFRRNVHKGTNLTGVDPQTEDVIRLFHPRADRWDEHFRFDGVIIRGRTAVGRTTVEVLRMNADGRVQLRVRLREAGLLPK